MKIDWGKISLKDFAGYVSEELRKQGIDATLVGGACVTIYSHNKYQSYDLDYVTYRDIRLLREALQKLGFEQKGKCFQHPDCKWFIDFVSPPVAIGNQPIVEFNLIKTPYGTIKLLLPEDSVKDRLASYYHWDDKQGLEQAVQICIEQAIDLKQIKKWSVEENHKEKYENFLKLLKGAKKK